MKSIWIGLFFTIVITTLSIAQSITKSNWQVVKTNNKLSARSECSLVAVQDKLYLIGGDGPALPVEAYDPKTNTWTKKAMAPMVIHHLQAVGLGAKIYVLDALEHS